MNDATFIEQFERLTLPPEHFTHQGHLRLAFLYLTRFDFATALEKISNGIKAYAESLGAQDKFNLTVTNALVTIIALRIEAKPAESWQTFLQQNQDLEQDAIGVLQEYYSEMVMFSDLAKIKLMPPDIKAIV